MWLHGLAGALMAGCGAVLLALGWSGGSPAIVVLSGLVLVSAFLMIRSGRPKQRR
jgi:asparagine N-glycosylation enzyme membrane subunit Stt3